MIKVTDTMFDACFTCKSTDKVKRIKVEDDNGEEKELCLCEHCCKVLANAMLNAGALKLEIR